MPDRSGRRPWLWERGVGGAVLPLEEGDVTVPAGTFPALRVLQAASTGYTQSAWFDRGAGLVTSASADLVSYSP